MDMSEKYMIAGVVIIALIGIIGIVLYVYYNYNSTSNFVLDSTSHVTQVGAKDTTHYKVPLGYAYTLGNTIADKAENAVLNFNDRLFNTPGRIDKLNYYQGFANNQYRHLQEEYDDTFIRQMQN